MNRQNDGLNKLGLIITRIKLLLFFSHQALGNHMQKFLKRRGKEGKRGFDTDIRYELNESYREMIEAAVDQKSSRKPRKDAYKCFDTWEVS